MENILLHQSRPILLSKTLDSEAVWVWGHIQSSPLRKNSKMTNIPPNRSRATSLSKCTYSNNLIFQMMFPVLDSLLTDTILIVSYYTESWVCAVFKQSLLLPCVIPIDQMKRSREKKEEDVRFHQCLADVFRNFCLSSLCFSTRKDQSTENTAMPVLAMQGRKTSVLPSLGCYVWHTAWLQPGL